VAKIFRANLRPGDFIFRPSQKTLGIVLLDAEASGAGKVCMRLHEAISRWISFGKRAVEIRVKFATSEQVAGNGSPGEAMLSTAESALEKTKRSDSTFMIAEAVKGSQSERN
jgi:GGDEF domain-containing protein